MKINNKILVSLLIVLIGAISLSAVSAADDVATDVVTSPVEQVEAVEFSDIDMSGVISEPVANSTTHTVKAGSSAADVQKIIDNSSAGDTISFEAGEYNWHEINDTGKAITLPHTLKIVGNNSIIECDNGFISATGAVLDGTYIKGITFNMVQDTKWNGRGIELKNVNNVLIENCAFNNGNAGVYSRGNTNITIQYCEFTGATNVTSIGSKNEQGTKAINIMGGSDHLIIGNYFGEDCLDGVSIANNAKHNFQFINNTFEENWYATFYGGGVSGVLIQGNTFKNNKIYDLGLKKAAGETKIINNTFITKDDCAPIYIEQGNTAHGAPSTIESITIKNNTFSVDNGTNPYEVVAVEVYSNGGPLLPLGTITITNNTYEDGIIPFAFRDANWGGANDTYIIGPITLNTDIKADTAAITTDDAFVMQLVTANGIAISNANVTITATYKDQKEIFNTTTDAFGLFSADLSAGNWTLEVAYAGTTTPINGYLYGASKTKVEVNVAGKTTLTINDNTIMKGGKLIYTLTDGNGNPIENVTVDITINGQTYNRVTDANGAASMSINLQPNEYVVTATCKVGNETVSAKDMITVTSNIITKDVTLFYKNGTAFEATVLDGNGKPVGAGENVTFNINGVFYTRQTNGNGTAKLTINLLPNTYTITTMYGGIQISNQVVVNPTLLTENLNLTFEDGSKFNATVLDGQGKALANQTVTFNINGVFYNRTTNENGTASLNINLMAGKYIITSMWNGYQVGNNVTVNPKA